MYEETYAIEELTVRMPIDIHLGASGAVPSRIQERRQSLCLRSVVGGETLIGFGARRGGGAASVGPFDIPVAVDVPTVASAAGWRSYKGDVSGVCQTEIRRERRRGESTEMKSEEKRRKMREGRHREDGATYIDGSSSRDARWFEYRRNLSSGDMLRFRSEATDAKTCTIGVDNWHYVIVL